MFTAVLEDEERRQQTMAALLAGIGLRHEVRVFDNAPDMIAWLEEHLAEVVLLALDHDLGPNRRRGDAVFDPGTGRDVVDFLVQRPPVCPVIVHSSNGSCAPGMMFALEYAGWPRIRVVPYNDLVWLRQSWIKAVQENLPEQHS